MIENTEARDSDNTRWWILAFVSLAMFGNYYVYDAIGPLAEQLERLLGFSDTEIGALNAIYSLPNIFLVLIGGVIVDRVYESGIVDGKGYVLSGSPAEKVNQVLHRVLYDLLKQSFAEARPTVLERLGLPADTPPST